MNVPKLRFKADDGSEFPEWEEKKIGDLIEIYDEKVNSDCELPILTSSKKYGIQYQNDHFGREQLHDISGYNVLPYGYCTYRNRSDGTDFTFNINTLCERGIVSKFYPVFTSKTTDLYVLASLLNNEKSTVKKIAYTAKGTGQKVLSITDLQNINVRIPCVAEQEKIASFLSTIDEIIQSTESELTAWQERKKGVMQKIFNREVRFKADDGSEFPEWEEKEIGKVGTFIKGAALSKADISDTGTPFVLYGELYTTYKEIAYTIKRKTEAVVAEKYYSKIGDVVIPTSGESPEEISTATCIMVPNVILAGDLNIFRSSIIDGRIMSYILNYQAKNKIATIAQGKSIVHIQAKELSKIRIKFPIDVEEQRKIADCLSSLDDVISQIQAELSAWKEFKKGLLQQMFV